MADSKITALTALTAADPANDMIPIVDVSDTPPASGNTKRISINNILACSPSATLASATITGDLTVATSGFAVRSSDKKVFVGTAPVSTAYQFFVTRGGTAGSIAQFTDGTAQTLTIDSAAGGLIVGNANNGYVSFNANGLEQYRIAPLGVFTWSDGAGGTRMTLNSTGLGVGVSPASDKLLVSTTAGIIAASTTADFNFRNAAGTAIQRLRYTDTDGSLTIGSATGVAYPVNIGGDTTTRAITIDASKNLGIGVQPSAWSTSASRKAIQLSTSGSISAQDTGTAPYTFVASNWVSTATGDQYILGAAAPATLYRQFNGTHSWFNAPSGTGALTFTQAMTLDASGRLITNSSTFTPPTLNTNGELNFIATSNTNVRFSYRGTDGVTRVANITLA